MCCGSKDVKHDCKGDYFKKNLSEEGAVKEEPKAEAPKTDEPREEDTETKETAKSSV